MAASALIAALVNHWLDGQNREAESQQRQDAVKRATALLGYQGTQPSDEEVDYKLHGRAPTLDQMTPDQVQAESDLNPRYAQLMTRENANKGQVENYRIASAMDEAANLKAGPNYRE